MAETEANPAKPARFPYIATILCAACVSMAAWTWMRYSYCWDVTVAWLSDRKEAIAHERWPYDAYVKFTGVSLTDRIPPDHSLKPGAWFAYLVGDADEQRSGPCVLVQTTFEKGMTLPKGGKYRGHVLATAYAQSATEGAIVSLSRSTSRFTGASVAGLVVGAMGVFVFTVAFRHWLKERRKAMLQGPS